MSHLKSYEDFRSFPKALPRQEDMPEASVFGVLPFRCMVLFS